MKIKAYARFQRAYRELPSDVQKRTDKQIAFLSENMNHPSLRAKKIKGREGIWEARVDYHHRLTFELAGDTIFLRVVGSHDHVLKNP
jgi:mRNA interferase RelE/StbE